MGMVVSCLPDQQLTFNWKVGAVLISKLIVDQLLMKISAEFHDMSVWKTTEEFICGLFFNRPFLFEVAP